MKPKTRSRILLLPTMLRHEAGVETKCSECGGGIVDLTMIAIFDEDFDPKTVKLFHKLCVDRKTRKQARKARI